VAPDRVVPLLIGATVGEIERELVLQTLARCEGNRTRAARVLGVSVRTLRNKIRQYSAEGMDVPAHH
jgi:DNA-binding NtrC family response regulator